MRASSLGKGCGCGCQVLVGCCYGSSKVAVKKKTLSDFSEALIDSRSFVIASLYGLSKRNRNAKSTDNQKQKKDRYVSIEQGSPYISRCAVRGSSRRWSKIRDGRQSGQPRFLETQQSCVWVLGLPKTRTGRSWGPGNRFWPIKRLNGHNVAVTVNSESIKGERVKDGWSDVDCAEPGIE